MFNLSLCHHGDEAITAVTIFPGRWLCALVLSALLWSGPLLANGAAIEPGHSGHWYDPQRSGEGWVLEVLDAERVLAYWFTYDEEGRQRWLMGVGGIVRDQAGDRIHFDELYDTRGGRFGPDFDPADVVRQVVGQATFRFADCARGDVEFRAYGQTGRHEMHRLGRVMGAGCAPRHGLPGRPVLTHAGQSGSWYDPTHAGEGYTLQWLDDGRALVVWFSYDAEGRQYWMLGMGERDGERLRIPELHATRGARFGDQFDPEDVERFVWGQLDLDLRCDGGPADYASPLPGFGSGRLALARLTRLHRLACPTVAPTLSELYRFELIEVPLNPPTGSASPLPWAIANQDTVVAIETTILGDGSRLLRWRPGLSAFEDIPFDFRFRPASVKIGSDPQRIAIDAITTDGDLIPMIRNGDGSWNALSNLRLNHSQSDGLSWDGNRVVGAGRSAERPLSLTPWTWDAANGQQALPLGPQDISAIATGIADDGRIVSGFQVLETDPNGPVELHYRGVRWINGGDPQVLADGQGHSLWAPVACSVDCGVIVGSGQAADITYDPDHAQAGRAWFWTERTLGVYLGITPDAMPGTGQSVTGITADGSLIVGGYSHDPGDGMPIGRGFLWTQATGAVSITSLLTEHGLLDDWSGHGAYGVSGAGDAILLLGARRSDIFAARAAVLRLIPRDPD